MYWSAESGNPENLAYLKKISQIHEVAFRRLLSGRKRMLPEVAELCEDIANLYLNVADEIRTAIISELGQTDPEADLPQPAPPCPLESLSEVRKD